MFITRFQYSIQLITEFLKDIFVILNNKLKNIQSSKESNHHKNYKNNYKMTKSIRNRYGKKKHLISFCIQAEKYVFTLESTEF